MQNSIEMTRIFVQDTVSFHVQRGSRWLDDVHVLPSNVQQRCHLSGIRIASGSF